MIRTFTHRKRDFAALTALFFLFSLFQPLVASAGVQSPTTINTAQQNGKTIWNMFKMNNGSVYASDFGHWVQGPSGPVFCVRVNGELVAFSQAQYKQMLVKGPVKGSYPPEAVSKVRASAGVEPLPSQYDPWKQREAQNANKPGFFRKMWDKISGNSAAPVKESAPAATKSESKPSSTKTETKPVASEKSTLKESFDKGFDKGQDTGKGIAKKISDGAKSMKEAVVGTAKDVKDGLVEGYKSKTSGDAAPQSKVEVQGKVDSMLEAPMKKAGVSRVEHENGSYRYKDSETGKFIAKEDALARIEKAAPGTVEKVQKVYKEGMAKVNATESAPKAEVKSTSSNQLENAGVKKIETAKGVRYQDSETGKFISEETALAKVEKSQSVSGKIEKGVTTAKETIKEGFKSGMDKAEAVVEKTQAAFSAEKSAGVKVIETEKGIRYQDSETGKFISKESATKRIEAAKSETLPGKIKEGVTNTVEKVQGGVETVKDKVGMTFSAEKAAGIKTVETAKGIRYVDEATGQFVSKEKALARIESASAETVQGKIKGAAKSGYDTVTGAFDSAADKAGLEIVETDKGTRYLDKKTGNLVGKEKALARIEAAEPETLKGKMKGAYDDAKEYVGDKVEGMKELPGKAKGAISRKYGEAKDAVKTAFATNQNWTLDAQRASGQGAVKFYAGEGAANAKGYLKSGFSVGGIGTSLAITGAMELGRQIVNGEDLSLGKVGKIITSGSFIGGMAGSVVGGAAGSFVAPALTAIPVVGGVMAALAPAMGAVAGGMFGSGVGGGKSFGEALKAVDWWQVAGQGAGSVVGAAIGSVFFPPFGTIAGGMIGGFVGGKLAGFVKGLFGGGEGKRDGGDAVDVKRNDDYNAVYEYGDGDDLGLNSVLSDLEKAPDVDRDDFSGKGKGGSKSGNGSNSGSGRPYSPPTSNTNSVSDDGLDLEFDGAPGITSGGAKPSNSGNSYPSTNNNNSVSGATSGKPSPTGSNGVTVYGPKAPATTSPATQNPAPKPATTQSPAPATNGGKKDDDGRSLKDDLGKIIGAGVGATAGAVIGHEIEKATTKDKSKDGALGEVIGGAVGAGIGILLGHEIDKKNDKKREKKQQAQPVQNAAPAVNNAQVKPQIVPQQQPQVSVNNNNGVKTTVVQGTVTWQDRQTPAFQNFKAQAMKEVLAKREKNPKPITPNERMMMERHADMVAMNNYLISKQQKQVAKK